MPVPDPQISLTRPEERQTQRQQIEEVLERAQASDGPLRVRIPVSLYDYADSRGYVFIRDAVWNLQLPSKQTTPETVERLIQTIGQCIVAIANEGSDRVLRKLAGDSI